MGGSTSQTTNQSSQTQPWTPAIPMLTNILGQLGNVPLTPTGGQSSAVNAINSAVAGMPNFGGQGINSVNGLFNSNTSPQQGMISNAYGSAANALMPMLSSGYTNPMTNPNLGAALSTLNQDITNQIGGQFAAAGRPLGTNAAGTQALARGLGQGEAGLLANEFNTLSGNQLAAANALPGLAGSAAGGMTAQQQAQYGNWLQGMQAAGMIPGLLTQPGTSQLTAANLMEELPFMNIQGIEQLGLPIAGLGAESSGTSTTTQQSPWWTTALGLGLLGTSLMPSDERIKDDIEQVGMLYDATPVYSYRYKGDHRPQIGVMAQDVEKRRPDAVHEIGGVKLVDYGKATERSRMLGMLHDLDMAA